jgi:two-component system phosphate regulon sensor histidine kinase PhoR
MRSNLNLSVFVACISLLGMICLQFFWLKNSYHDQENKLLDIVDNTLSKVQLYSGVRSSIYDLTQNIISNTIDNASDSINPTTKNKIEQLEIFSSKDSNNLNRQLVVGPERDSILVKLKMRMAIMDTSFSESYTLEEYQSKIQYALLQKHIDIPFEVALLNSDNQITDCSIDTNAFLRMPLKSRLENVAAIQLNDKQSGVIQLGFSDVFYFIIKQMKSLILLEVSIIFLTILSFYFMISFFYKQRRIAKIKSDFMNNMTHELKTPVSSVSLALELMHVTGDSEKSIQNKEFLSIAQNELKRLSLLIEKVLKMAAFEQLQVKVKKEWININDMVEEIVSSMKPLLIPEKMEIITDIYPTDLQVHADRVLLGSVLQNLLENAIKYSDPNKPKLRIGIECWEHNNYFLMAVRDNGIGISIQDQQKVFDKFYRVTRGDTHDTKGYGLGLSYVKEVATLHHGKITLDSILKTGTTFTIEIPKQYIQ